jgi:hypothetical protein
MWVHYIILSIINFPHWIFTLSYAAMHYYVGNTEYGYGLAASVDQHVNAVWGGHRDETISSRVGRAKAKGRGGIPLLMFAAVIDWLAIVVAGDRNHVEKYTDWSFEDK